MIPWRRFVLGASLVAVVASLSACQSNSRVDLISYKDPYFPENYHFAPESCAYRTDGGGDCHVVARATGGDDEQSATQQWLHVHIFWKPRPGKTRDNPTSMDAVIRYAIRTPRGTSLYTGTGFAYPSRRSIDGRLAVSIESGRMSVRSQSGNEAEMLGETRLRGRLLAASDSAVALDLLRQLDTVLADQE